ncbi:hypothetical protein GXW83_05000 [Streptacidiphilus sp. PB12-B1b]|uniref:hypothetical protein n=1 Tax=Streptacidiphilus sp. PB12-B1b TaxID=2705012 RepID=UPI0015FC0073|nr:hypothetical protein [Streptacidiphilus sp. PB12-B1b]QMU75210.1 hypothetical protein GXW83_05000 [Streptacidiphilus sp. PB12-B1b]
MAWDFVTFALVGLVVGAGAAMLLPRLFRAPRTLTVLTGVISALLIGGLTRIVLGADSLLASSLVALVGAGLLVSVLARPDQRSHPLHRAPRRPHHA